MFLMRYPPSVLRSLIVFAISCYLISLLVKCIATNCRLSSPPSQKHRPPRKRKTAKSYNPSYYPRDLTRAQMRGVLGIVTLVDLVASRLISWLETVLVCSVCGRLDLIDMEVPSILTCGWDDEWICVGCC